MKLKTKLVLKTFYLWTFVSACIVTLLITCCQNQENPVKENSESSPSIEPKKWTFLLYDDADFSGELGKAYDPIDDFSRMVRSGENIDFLVLQDTYGDEAKLWYIKGNHKPVLKEKMGELNMGSSRTLSDFLEYAKVFDNYYGTTQDGIRDQLAQGVDVVLEIDWQGARQVRERVDDTVSIFILPPSQIVLRERLTARGQDSSEVIARRMRDAKAEMSHYHEFDYLVVNDMFEQALEELRDIILAVRSGQTVQPRQIGDKLQQLLA